MSAILQYEITTGIGNRKSLEDKKTNQTIAIQVSPFDLPPSSVLEYDGLSWFARVSKILRGSPYGTETHVPMSYLFLV